MGSCTNYCNACGDEKSQINTLDPNQLKNGIENKDM
jgi:hypothetical protein